MDLVKRRIGLEQEFFLVDEAGHLSDRADEFLTSCQLMAQAQGLNPKYFVAEFVKSMVEINTPPADTAKELGRVYLTNLKLALCAAQQIGLRLYPLSSYPLHTMPVMRDQPNYHIQARTVGYEQFLHAGKCTGTHLHLEVPPGVIDPRVAISYNSTLAEREELLNIFNLATACDSALISLTRACPFYEGQAIGLAAHTIRYRGSEIFGWEGVYTHLQPVGSLMSYAESVEGLVEQQFARYYAWLQAMEKASIEPNLFKEAGGDLLKSAWNPVRLNKLGTVEIRCIDSNYPSVILAVITLLEKAAHRVRCEKLTVRPAQGMQIFELVGDRLYVPDFEYLNGELLYTSATEGIKNPKVRAYVDSILQFAIKDGGEGANFLLKLSRHLDRYQTIEASILQEFTPTNTQLSLDVGLRLVRSCCDKLEEQVSWIDIENPLAALDTDERLLLQH
ncbi:MULTISPECIES: glutamate-cysteine ligase family protein [unclassified Nostoc]|uniref:glutamate-cysteine ligase family protein n=1 Tax=unclassified Nostoc TaxID=2593658 RepID=UPI002AD3431A|nr:MULTISPECIES: glutamate-cysteine ligase family protein [unclassified Nostoc]MDZ8093500.1 glutamate-cysteine ligase family protein [Nostoc sp. DedQUE05]MDZ8132263.1 glutamate-cysteine ligase family protein [Nostoc sp. DedQUE07]